MQSFTVLPLDKASIALVVHFFPVQYVRRPIVDFAEFRSEWGSKLMLPASYLPSTRRPRPQIGALPIVGNAEFAVGTLYIYIYI